MRRSIGYFSASMTATINGVLVAMSADELRRAIKTVFAGDTYFSALVAQRVAQARGQARVGERGGEPLVPFLNRVG